MAFLLGAMHALEPGHGKTAMATYMLNGTVRWFDSLWIALTAGLSHTAIIIVLAVATHLSSHLVLDAGAAPEILNHVAGFLLIAIGIWLMASREHSKKACCSQDKEKASGIKVPALLGMTLGLFPCPSLLAALALALNSGRTDLGILSVLLFTAGMVISMFLCGLTLRWISKNGPLVHWRLPISWRRLQGILIILIGLYYAV